MTATAGEDDSTWDAEFGSHEQKFGKNSNFGADNYSGGLEESLVFFCKGQGDYGTV